MPEKLLTTEEVSSLLGISEEEVKRLARKAELPAYQVGGRFLRFRKEQIKALGRDVAPGLPESGPGAPSADKVLDFLYFNDFYVISGIIILLILWFIF